MEGNKLHRRSNSFTGRALDEVRIFDGSGDHRIVSGCDCQRDYEELPAGICTDSDWPFADAVSLDRNSDLQCVTKPGALDCDCAVWRFRSTRLSLAIPG